MERKSTFSLLSGFAKGARRLFVIAAFATAASTFFSFLAPQVVRFTVDFVIGDGEINLPAAVAAIIERLGGRDALRESIIACALAVLACAVLSGVFGYVSQMCLTRGTETFAKGLRDRLFEHIQRLPFKWHTDNFTGDIIQRCTSDVETIHGFVSRHLIEVGRTVVLIVAALALMFSMNVRMTLVSAAFMPFIVLYSTLFHGRISKQFLRADEAEGRLMTAVQENLTGVRVVRSFGRGRHELGLFDAKLNAFTDSWIELGYTLGLFWGIGDLATGAQLLAVVCAGAFWAATDAITLGELLAFISYTQALAWPVRSLGRTLSEFSKAGVSVKRIREILDEPAEGVGDELQGSEPASGAAKGARSVVSSSAPLAVAKAADAACAPSAKPAVADTATASAACAPSAKPASAAPLAAAGAAFAAASTAGADIEFRNVRFSYKEKTILDNVSFRVPAGTTFGILGATGSGKSTVTYLLNRLYELPSDGGAIFVGGVNIRDIPRDKLRRSVGLVLQESFLFSKTIKENIEIASVSRDLARVRRMAGIASVDDSIMEFHDGYDTVVGERGVTLSGGQKQRIAIARTLMMDCPIMVFDDSMSAVDMETDEKIRVALRENTGGATVVLISHRINTLMQADMIIVLQDGRVTQSGTHEELLSEDGPYRRVYKMQSDASKEAGSNGAG